MKAKNVLLAGLMIIFVTGCFVKSLHPFYNETDLLFKKELLGTWAGKDSSVWIIEQGTKSTGFFKPEVPENAYQITYIEKKGTSKFSVHLFKLNNRLFLDFYPQDVDASTDMMSSHLAPMHTVAQVTVDPAKLVIRWYNEEWLIGLFKQNKIRIAHEKIPIEPGKGGENNFQVILTASTGDLQKFMMKYSDDPEAFKSDFTYVLTKNNLK